MSEYESLRKDIDGIAGSLGRYADAVAVFTEVSAAQIKALWADNAELRDELHALANRVETLTRARLTEPAEVGAKMVDGGRADFICPETGCYITHPHLHTTTGVLYR